MATSNSGNGGGPGNSPTDLHGQLGHYRIQKKLGDGGMGTVYLVDNTKLDRQEALKVPHFDSQDADQYQRFLVEAQSAAKLDHPNLCQVYDVGTVDNVSFLTMRYLQGKPLSDYTGRPQPVRKVVETVAKLAQGLEYAHSKGVIHRDLKPHNIMLCAGHTPVVMDFGLAKLTQQNRKLTRLGTMLGTPAYMPPEQVLGNLAQMGPASDVYSLGVILFQLLTGRLPFEGDTEELLDKVLHSEAPAPSLLHPGLSPTLDAVCRQALAKTPAERYPTMKAFAAALMAYLRATPPTVGAGNFVPTTASVADILHAATVAPSKSPPPPSPALPGSGVAKPSGSKVPSSAPRPGSGVTKPSGSKPPSSARPGSGVTKPSGSKPPSSPPRPAPVQPLSQQPTVVTAEDELPEDEPRSTRSGNGLLVGIVCVMLMVLLGGLGGGGMVLYVLSQRKADPADNEARTTTTALAPVALVTPAPPTTTPVSPETDTPVPPAPVPQETRRTEEPSTTPPERPSGTERPVEPPTPPSVSLPPAPSDPPPRVSTPPLPDLADLHVLLREDFKGVEVGARPKNWQGANFRVQQEDGVPSLEVGKNRDLCYLTLPHVALPGDFVLECQFRFGGSPETSSGGSALQVFRLELSSTSSTPLLVVLNQQGTLRIGGGQKQTVDFRPFEKVHFRLSRKGDLYSVSVNDRVGGSPTILGKGTFEEVRLGLSGTAALRGGDPARLYAVTIASPEKEVEQPPGDAPFAGIQEDFSGVGADPLPEGWTKSKLDNISVQTEAVLPGFREAGQGGLELRNPAQGDLVTLPKTDLHGNFFADLGVSFRGPNEFVSLAFRGPKTRPLIVNFSGQAVITVPGLPSGDARASWNPGGRVNVLRVAHLAPEKGYRIELNDEPVGGLVPLSVASGPFTEVQVGLGAGVPSPRITFVRVMPLKDPPPPKR